MNSPRIQGKGANLSPSHQRNSMNSSQRGPYFNPIRTSQEHVVRLSMQVKERESQDEFKNDPFKDSAFREKTMTVAEISRHSYFRKSKGSSQMKDFEQEPLQKQQNTSDDKRENGREEEDFDINPNLTRKLQDVNFIENSSTVAEGERRETHEDSDGEIEEINPLTKHNK